MPVPPSNILKAGSPPRAGKLWFELTARNGVSYTYNHPMRTFTVILTLVIACAGSFAKADTTNSLPVPSRAQREWLDAGIGIFMHWAPNVYQGGEGDNLSTPREKITPDRFDAAKLVQAAKSANAGYIIFVAKHVGGYCAWQTDTTDYSLKTSPWENGKGDMVGDLAKACRQQGLRFGVYLSPRSDIHHVGGGGHAANPEKQKEYNEIYRRQLTEAQRAKIAKAGNRDNSDLDFCEFNGKLIINYCWGNQVGTEFIAEAEYAGTAAQYLEGWFPDASR